MAGGCRSCLPALVEWRSRTDHRGDEPRGKVCSPQVALGKVIRAMGVKEFAAKVKMAGPNVLRAIHPRHNPTQDTMNRLLKPFRLKLSLARIDEPRDRRAA